MQVFSVDELLHGFEKTFGDWQVSEMTDLRRKLTANIDYNLYGNGIRDEGRKALSVRDSLDKAIFESSEADIKGDFLAIEYFRHGIALETLAEQMQILEGVISRAKETRKTIKSGAVAILSDPDRLLRFSPKHQTLIRDAATGMAFLAQWRLNKVLNSLRQNTVHLINKYPELSEQTATLH